MFFYKKKDIQLDFLSVQSVIRIKTYYLILFFITNKYIYTKLELMAKNIIQKIIYSYFYVCVLISENICPPQAEINMLTRFTVKKKKNIYENYTVEIQKQDSIQRYSNKSKNIQT